MSANEADTPALERNPAMKNRSNPYANVTKEIIAQLEKGVAPWVKPWADGNPGAFMLPANARTGNRYSGVNVITLWATAMKKGYSDHRWVSFKQAQALGGSVRKGEKSVKIVFAKTISKTEENAKGEEERKSFYMLREWSVFNVEQCDGLNIEPITAPEPRNTDEVPEHVTTFIEATGADITHGGDRAAYAPALDQIMLPPAQAFDSADAYASTALHELAHWTGHESRLKRDICNGFGTEAYAREELTAELTAAFLCADLGIASKLQHAEYIGNWIELLKSDDRAIFSAARAAENAATFLREGAASDSEDNAQLPAAVSSDRKPQPTALAA